MFVRVRDSRIALAAGWMGARRALQPSRDSDPGSRCLLLLPRRCCSASSCSPRSCRRLLPRERRRWGRHEWCPSGSCHTGSPCPASGFSALALGRTPCLRRGAGSAYLSSARSTSRRPTPFERVSPGERTHPRRRRQRASTKRSRWPATDATSGPAISRALPRNEETTPTLRLSPPDCTPPRRRQESGSTTTRRTVSARARRLLFPTATGLYRRP